MKPKKLNRQVVRSAATMLMLIDGNTTASTVKEYLQERGYRAGQSEVSCWLLRIAQREEWVVNATSVHRVYQFPMPTNATTAGMDVAPTVWLSQRVG